jgi:hypothetical protein
MGPGFDLYLQRYYILKILDHIVPNGSVAFRIEHQLLGVNFVSRKGRKKNTLKQVSTSSVSV